MPSLLAKQLTHYKRWDFLVFLLITVLSILNKQVTVFYLIYFFWWNELLRILLDSLLMRQNPNAVVVSTQKKVDFGGFFLMGIYLVFIVVFFGFIANSKQTDLIIKNMEVLFFHNWFFNANLLFVLLERIILHKTHQPLQVHFGGFTPNMIVMHIAIILGGILIFFVVNNYPTVFTPENVWGSVVIAMPFLLLRAIAWRLSI